MENDTNDGVVRTEGWGEALEEILEDSVNEIGLAEMHDNSPGEPSGRYALATRSGLCGYLLHVEDFNTEGELWAKAREVAAHGVGEWLSYMPSNAWDLEEKRELQWPEDVLRWRGVPSEDGEFWPADLDGWFGIISALHSADFALELAGHVAEGLSGLGVLLDCVRSGDDVKMRLSTQGYSPEEPTEWRTFQIVDLGADGRVDSLGERWPDEEGQLFDAEQVLEALQQHLALIGVGLEFSAPDREGGHVAYRFTKEEA
jgi:hypothetical protein